jgi:hypothetical protein
MQLNMIGLASYYHLMCCRDLLEHTCYSPVERPTPEGRPNPEDAHLELLSLTRTKPLATEQQKRRQTT